MEVDYGYAGATVSGILRSRILTAGACTRLASAILQSDPSLDEELHGREMEDGRSFLCAPAEIFRSGKRVLRPPILLGSGLALVAALPHGRQKGATERVELCPAQRVRLGHRSQNRPSAKRRNLVPVEECALEDQTSRLTAAHQSIRYRRRQAPRGLPMSRGVYSWKNTPTIRLTSVKRIYPPMSLENHEDFPWGRTQYLVWCGRISPLY